jgi:primosomal replication protein N
MSISYRLLGILLEIAPNGVAQEQCSTMYREAQAEGATEEQLQVMMAGVIVDGRMHGNWPWTVMS